MNKELVILKVTIRKYNDDIDMYLRKKDILKAAFVVLKRHKAMCQYRNEIGSKDILFQN